MAPSPACRSASRAKDVGARDHPARSVRHFPAWRILSRASSGSPPSRSASAPLLMLATSRAHAAGPVCGAPALHVRRAPSRSTLRVWARLHVGDGAVEQRLQLHAASSSLALHPDDRAISRSVGRESKWGARSSGVLSRWAFSVVVPSCASTPPHPSHTRSETRSMRGSWATKGNTRSVAPRQRFAIPRGWRIER